MAIAANIHQTIKEPAQRTPVFYRSYKVVNNHNLRDTVSEIQLHYQHTQQPSSGIHGTRKK